MSKGKSLEVFEQFAKSGNKPSKEGRDKAVIYTRVSTKEQADNNASLSIQKEYCERYALKLGLSVVKYFGGTHESAKSDERKEFQKMLAFVKRHKDIACIIVYSFDRFSRTGASGVYIVEQLNKKGIDVKSATQEVDSSTSSGEFQRDVLFAFGKFDNGLRRDKTIAGMQDKLRKGFVCGSIPFGYTNTNPGRNKEPKLIINEDGKLLKKAFELKAKHDLTHQEITEQLRKHGWTRHRKRLTELFRNPIYCGLIVSSVIPGEVIAGKHPPLVSKEVFLKVNNILENNNYGYKYNKDEENLPLKQFVIADSCGTPYTGYVVKKKNLYYYKNNRIGSKENRSAKVMHKLFIELLETYQLNDPKWKVPMKEVLMQAYLNQHEESLNDILLFEKQLTEIETNIEKIEMRYAIGEIERDLYTKFKNQFNQQLTDIHEKISKSSFNLSNLELALDNALEYSLELPKIWTLGNLEEKRKVQKMVFPNGIRYNRESDSYRTIGVNTIFNDISHIQRATKEHKKRTSSKKLNLSYSVNWMGLEPITSCLTGRRFSKLNYQFPYFNPFYLMMIKTEVERDSNP